MWDLEGFGGLLNVGVACSFNYRLVYYVLNRQSTKLALRTNTTVLRIAFNVIV